ncbi:MAG: hypothetical protein Q4615_10425 [Paracoccus aminovorans]|nr:hypothetical protein [Paracoccus aminovorans]
MLKGALALVLRQALLVFAGMLASAGIITATADLGYYCFDTRFVADATATALMLFLGGGASAGASMLWRIWAKKGGGVT